MALNEYGEKSKCDNNDNKQVPRNGGLCVCMYWWVCMYGCVFVCVIRCLTKRNHVKLDNLVIWMLLVKIARSGLPTITTKLLFLTGLQQHLKQTLRELSVWERVRQRKQPTAYTRTARTLTPSHTHTYAHVGVEQSHTRTTFAVATKL